MQVQAINNRGKYNYQQNQNYKQKVNPSFTALKSVNYNGYFFPEFQLDHAKMVKGLLDNPAFQKFYTKYDVEVLFSKLSYEIDGIDLQLFCKDALKDNKPNNLFQKIKRFFKEDERDEYELFFNSKFDNFNTLSETKLEEKINLAKEILISSKKDEEKIAEILKSVEEKLKK